MTKKYYAVSGYYGFGYFDNWDKVLRYRKYVGKTKYVEGFATPAEAAIAAYSAFRTYNINYKYKLLNTPLLKTNRLQFRKHLVVPEDGE